MRNLAAKVPTDLWLEFKTRVSACYQAPSRAIPQRLAGGRRPRGLRRAPAERARSCIEDDFEASSPTCACPPPVAASFE